MLYLILLIIKALRRYLKTSDMKNEKNKIKKSLGEIIKEGRIKQPIQVHLID